MNDIELPDFEKIFELIDKIGNLSREVMELELQIDVEEARITMEAMTNPKYYIGGKVPSQTSIDNTYKITGFDDSLIPIRRELVSKKWFLDILKVELDMYKKIIDVWRTNSANERSTIV